MELLLYVVNLNTRRSPLESFIHAFKVFVVWGFFLPYVLLSKIVF